MKVGDKVLVSPELTNKSDWTEATIIEVEENPFVGIVISAETKERDIFFGRVGMFKAIEETACLR